MRFSFSPPLDKWIAICLRSSDDYASGWLNKRLRFVIIICIAVFVVKDSLKPLSWYNWREKRKNTNGEPKCANICFTKSTMRATSVQLNSALLQSLSAPKLQVCRLLLCFLSISNMWNLLFCIQPRAVPSKIYMFIFGFGHWFWVPCTSTVFALRIVNSVNFPQKSQQRQPSREFSSSMAFSAVWARILLFLWNIPSLFTFSIAPLSLSLIRSLISVLLDLVDLDVLWAFWICVK